jgi:hypothetical protein
MLWETATLIARKCVQIGKLLLFERRSSYFVWYNQLSVDVAREQRYLMFVR